MRCLLTENKVPEFGAEWFIAVVKAINAHINNPGVCEQGCDALLNMSANGKNIQIKQQNKNKMNR